MEIYLILLLACNFEPINHFNRLIAI